jgi:hypothetical protein
LEVFQKGEITLPDVAPLSKYLENQEKVTKKSCKLTHAHKKDHRRLQLPRIPAADQKPPGHCATLTCSRAPATPTVPLLPCFAKIKPVLPSDRWRHPVFVAPSDFQKFNICPSRNCLNFQKTHIFMSSTTEVMSTTEIANRLVELCRKGDFEGALNELFADDAVSIEPHGTADFQKETKGLDAIRGKGKKWNEMVEEYHGGTVSEPLLGENSFAVIMNMSVTMKGHGKMDMKELCVYNVRDGKIVSEQFFM